MAQSVTGIVWVFADDEALKVMLTEPLTRLPWLRLAVTPLGRPEIWRFTVPYPNETTRAVATAVAADIVYALESTVTRKSDMDGIGTVQ
jgi:hypothetical protein